MRSRLTRSTRWLRRMETRLYAFVALETGLAVGVLIVSFVDPFDIASSVGWNWPLFTALLAAATRGQGNPDVATETNRNAAVAAKRTESEADEVTEMKRN